MCVQSVSNVIKFKVIKFTCNLRGEHLGASDHFPFSPHFLLLGPRSTKPLSHLYLNLSLTLKREPVNVACGMSSGLPQYTDEKNAR